MRAPRSFLRLFSVLLLTLPAVAGCAACGSDPDTPDGGSETDDDAGESDPCAEIAFGDIGLDVAWDVETTYSAPITTALGGEHPDHLVFTFVNYNERFGPLAIGTFSLADPPNDNRGPCAECITVFVDQEGESAPPAKTFFQSDGSIRLDTDPRSGTFKGRVEGLRLVEVTIDPFTLESTVVEGGECLRAADFDVDFKHVPPEWTCDAALYDSGGVCNCACGTFDPDCECDPFVEGDCPDVIEDDCAEGDVCTFEGCRATCEIFAEPQVPCDVDELCAFDLGIQICIPAQGRVNTAELGQSCATGGPGFVQYCQVENSLPQGMCDDEDGVCRPLCTTDAECAEGLACWFVYGLPEDEVGMGYCRPEQP